MSKHNHSLTKSARAEIAVPPPVVLGPRARAEARSLSLTDLWQLLVRRRLPILGVTAAVFLAVVAYLLIATPLYEGVARLQVDPTRSSSLGFDEKPAPNDMESRVKTEVAILQSSSVALQVMQSLSLYSNPKFAGTGAGDHADFSRMTAARRQRLCERFDDHLMVKVIPNTQVIEIRFRSPDPGLATSVANCMIDEYMRRNFQTRIDGTTQVSQWLSRQMDEIRSSTTAAQQELAEFQRKHNFIGSDESDNIVTDRPKQLHEELTQAEAERIVKEGRYRLAGTANPELIAAIVPGTTTRSCARSRPSCGPNMPS